MTASFGPDVELRWVNGLNCYMYICPKVYFDIGHQNRHKINMRFPFEID